MANVDGGFQATRRRVLGGDGFAYAGDEFAGHQGDDATAESATDMAYAAGIAEHRFDDINQRVDGRNGDFEIAQCASTRVNRP